MTFPAPVQPPELTAEEKAEWLYIYRERIGISCEDRMPDKPIHDRAIREANRATGIIQNLL
jgi:hypothetical protein